MSQSTVFAEWAIPSQKGKSATQPLHEAALQRRALRGKRIFDLVFAVLISPLLAPFFLVIPLAIWWESGRPIFFRHTRLGKGGRIFGMWKFRSMVNGADKVFEQLLDSDPSAKREFAKKFKLRGDPRITAVGHFLRRTSLDELPQVWNVLKGEMSWVGPRPIVDAETHMYGACLQKLLSVDPGVTGLWQVSGRSELSYSHRVKLDMEYIDRASLWLDLKLILRTVVAVMTQNGAL